MILKLIITQLIDYVVFENHGLPVSGLTNVTNADFSLTDIGDLKNTSKDYIQGFSNHEFFGALNGTYSIAKFNGVTPSWDIEKQLNFQISPNSDFGYFKLKTNKIFAKSLRTSISFMVKSNDYYKSTTRMIVDCYDSNGILVDTISQVADYNGKWGQLPINEWCIFTTSVNTSSIQLKPQTSYLTIEMQLETKNSGAIFNFTNLLCEFN